LIAALFGIRDGGHCRDTVGWSEAAFQRIQADYLDFAANLGPARILCIPVCALHGDNVTRASRLMPCYRGPTGVVRAYPVASAIALQFRNGRLTGWKKDWELRRD
jgi:sulfate adenylyltransferase subunit 1 (EFTu-like GTPase family)